MDLLVAVPKNDRLAPASTLRHVMRHAGNDDAGKTRHIWNVPGTRGRSMGIMSPESALMMQFPFNGSHHGTQMPRVYQPP